MAVCPNGHDSASDDFCDICGMRIAGPPSSPLSPATGSAPAGAPSTVAGGPSPCPGQASAEPCPRCGTPRTGQFCESCGFNFGGPRFTAASPPASSGGYSTSQPGPGTGGSSTSQPAPASGGYSRPGPASPDPDAGGFSWAQRPPSGPSLQSAPSGPPASTIPPTAVAPSVSPAPPAEAAPSVPGSPSMSSFPYPQATWTAVVGADRAYYDRVQALTGPEGAAVAFPSYCAERRFQLVGTQMRIGRRSVSRGLSPEIDLTGPPADPGISRLHAVLIATPDGNWAVLDPGSANGTLVNGSEIGTGDQVPLHDGDRINLGAWTAITVHRGLGNSLPGVGHRRATTDDPRH